MSRDSKSALLALLQNEAELPAAPLPVERLAFALANLGTSSARVSEVASLLADGITAPLLYQTHPEAVLGRLETALPGLTKEQRFEILAASLWMRPLRDEDVARYAAFSLDALGLRADTDVEPPESVEQKLVLYRWSRLLVPRTTHVAAALGAVLAERGLPSTGGNPFETFQDWLGLRAAYVVTPRKSPTALRLLKEAQREDWIDMPWLLATPDATFSLEEVEEDSSDANMQDGERVTEWFRTQVTRHGDFFAQCYGWLPRTSEETARAEAHERGITVLEPADFDNQPRAVLPEEMSASSHESWIRAVKALSDVREGALPVDVTLTFFHGADDTQVGAFEFGISSTLKNDGERNVVRLYFGADPTPIVEALSGSGAHLETSSLPRALSALFPLCQRVRITTPAGLFFDLSKETVSSWGYAPSEVSPAPSEASKAPSEVTPLFAAALAGHLSVNSDEELEPFRMTLSEVDGKAQAELSLQGNSYTMSVESAAGRVTIRQRENHTPFTFDGEWDAESSTFRGLWRMHFQGGTFTARAEETSEVEPTAEELFTGARGGWLDRVSVDLEALRYPGELVHLERLFEDAHFRTAYVQSARDRALRTTSKNLDAQVGINATELHPTLMPLPFRALEHVVQKLGFQGKVRLWVHNAENLSAFVTEDSGVVTVHFSSGLLEALDEQELQIVIAHEIGHVLFGHQELAMRVQGTNMSEATQAEYFALRRHQELSTDRVGMLVSDKPESAFLVQAMLKTGIRKRELFGETSAIVAHAKEEVANLRKRTLTDRMLDTHPYLSIRTVALDAFASSQLLRDLRAHGKCTAPEEAFLELSRFLEVPVAKVSSDDAEAAKRMFLALAALQLAEADGSTSAREARNMALLDPAIAPVLHEVLAWSHARRHVEILSRSRAVRRSFSVPEREQLMVKLLGVVRSDNVVMYAESDRFVQLGGLLDIDTPTFQKLVDKLYKSSRF